MIKQGMPIPQKQFFLKMYVANVICIQYAASLVLRYS